MNLETFAKMRALESAYISHNSRLLDHVLHSDQAEEAREAFKLKRIQFDASPELFERLENICAALQCSKREFLDMAVHEAIQRADQIFCDTIKEAEAE